MVPRHAARFVKKDYWQTSYITAMLKELKWEILDSRRTHLQLKYVHKMPSNKVVLSPILKETPTVTKKLQFEKNLLLNLLLLSLLKTLSFTLLYHDEIICQLI